MMGKLLLIMVSLILGAVGVYLTAPLVRYALIPITGGVSLHPDFLRKSSSDQWLSSEPIDIDAELARGKLVLIDFWTYSCINCVRSVPYTEMLFRRYRNHGLMVIGIHSPEFSFEKSSAAIRAAMQRMGITYPVVNDAEQYAWNQIGNKVWPARYLIAPGRRIIHAQFGEGHYESEHAIIRRALVQHGHELPPFVSITPPLVPGALPTTPELYAGTASLRRSLGNAARLVLDESVQMILPSPLVENAINLEGIWRGHREYAESMSDGRIVVPYQGQAVYCVLDAPYGPRDVEVLYDNQIPGELLRGDDVRDAAGRAMMTIHAPRMYMPIAHKAPYGHHILTLNVPPGIRLAAITFGAYDS
jgi:thiol-disulfide isomerase/thioredoxin